MKTSFEFKVGDETMLAEIDMKSDFFSFKNEDINITIVMNKETTLVETKVPVRPKKKVYSRNKDFEKEMITHIQEMLKKGAVQHVKVLARMLSKEHPKYPLQAFRCVIYKYENKHWYITRFNKRNCIVSLTKNYTTVVKPVVA